MTDWLQERIASFTERSFLALETERYTYADLNHALASSRKHFQSSGIRPGDTVLLNGDYTLQGIAALLALFQIKAVGRTRCHRRKQRTPTTHHSCPSPMGSTRRAKTLHSSHSTRGNRATPPPS